MNDLNDKVNGSKKIKNEIMNDAQDFAKKGEHGKIEQLYPFEMNTPEQNVLPQTLSLVDDSEEVSKLNPEIELLTTSDPDEEKIRKGIEDKFAVNKKNKNQPL